MMDQSFSGGAAFRIMINIPPLHDKIDKVEKSSQLWTGYLSRCYARLKKKKCKLRGKVRFRVQGNVVV
jgi:hypothetical protein